MEVEAARCQKARLVVVHCKSRDGACPAAFCHITERSRPSCTASVCMLCRLHWQSPARGLAVTRNVVPCLKPPAPGLSPGARINCIHCKDLTIWWRTCCVLQIDTYQKQVSALNNSKAILETACYCVQRAAGFCLWANMLHQQLSDQGREEQSEPIRKSFRIDRAGLMNCYLQGPGVGVPSRVAHIRPSSVRSGAGSQPGSPAATGRTSGSMPGSPRKDEDADDLLHKVHFTWRPQRHSRLSGPWRARGYSPQTHISFWMQCHLA